MGAQAEVSRSHRAVFDTNVAVSALLFRAGRLAWLRTAWEVGAVIPVVSAETVAELVRVLSYPKFELTEDETKNMLAQYMQGAEAVAKISARVRIPHCRDPDDRAFLRLAYGARVEALVTGDTDLLAIAAVSRIAILTPTDFRSKLGL